MEPLRLGTPNSRETYYTRFSENEFERRYTAVRGMMDEEGLDVLLVYGDGGFGHQPKTYYLTNYQPPWPTYLAFFADPDEPTTIFIGISNHVQYVREVSEVEDLRLMLPDPPSGVIDRIREAGLEDGTVGLVGDDPRYNLLIPYKHYQMLETKLGGDLVDVSSDYIRLISIASDEELERVERAAGVLDAMMEALEETITPGVTELDLKQAMVDAGSAAGGVVGTDFISSAPMTDAEPGEPIPWKHPSSRTIKNGDVVTTEISASYRGYSSQIHRPYAVEDRPTTRYQDLFEVAEETYDRVVESLQPGNTAQDVYEAMAPVEESDYKIYDVMCHGYGGAYRHPFIGVQESNYWPGAEDQLTEEWEFKENMVVVVQPNVLTEDERAALQYGTTIIIRDSGPEVILEYPTEFIQT